jgi:hypothetical protein
LRVETSLEHKTQQKVKTNFSHKELLLKKPPMKQPGKAQSPPARAWRVRQRASGACLPQEISQSLLTRRHE